MKRIVAVLLAAAIALPVFAGGGQQSGGAAAPAAGGAKKSYTFRYAELNPDGHIMDLAADHFAELVSQKSGGRIKIEVYPGGQLGPEKDVYQSLQIGSVDMCRGNTNSMGDFGAKKLTLFGLPFIFRDRAHLWSVLNSDIGAEFLTEMEDIKASMVGLFYLDEGARNFFSIMRYPLNSIIDYKGRKFRVPTTELMSDTVAALGIQSTPIAFGELYSALQTGVVDGAEQPHSGYYSNKFYEVAPNYMLTGHTYSPGIVLASEKCWSSLDAEDQALIREAAKETEVWNRANIEELDNQLLEDIKKDGANVIEVPDKTPYINATKAVVTKYASGYEDYYNRIINMK
jgi:tripartite ATP-independent transporter DctP family solute receptor